MKKHLLWIFTAAALLAGGTSCTDDPKVDNVGRVGILQTDLTADGKGDDVVFNVTSNAYWHIDFTDPQTGESVRWITADAASGTGDAVVTLTVGRNRSSSVRTAYVNVVTDSEMATASILLTQGAGGGGGGEGYSFPICEIFQIDDAHNLADAYIEENNFISDNGLIISRTGGYSDLRFVCPCHTSPKENPWFQRGISAGFWETGDAWEVEIPVKDELSGSLRYSFGSRRDNSGAWTCEWSGDGESWTVFDGNIAGGSSDAMWKSIDFTIPAEKKIPAGGKLIIRMTPADASKLGSTSNPTTLFQHGICITKAEAAKTTLPPADKETIAFSWGFDDVADAKAAYIDLPIGFMTSWNAGAYSLPKELADIVDAESCWSRPGFLQVGRGDEALITRYTQGAYTIKLASRFEAMNISKADLKLTFLASAMVDAYGVPTDPGVVVTTDEASGATVEGTIEGMENNKFKEFTLFVRNATPATKITITSAPMVNSTDDVRFFLDDILLKVEGEPERPSADDPVKAEVSAIRALKGAAAVTISDNLYIQGRVVAVDNVPADCFALADENAGIFVKLANHGLAAGDMVDVIVKDAQLATNADGLLVVTPAAADKVSKGQTAAQMPAAKAISVADLKAGTYEAMYVELPESQIIDSDLAKTMAGDVTLELADQATVYTMKTFSGASFAAQTVPQKSGAVKGVAGSSFLLPTALTDLAGMTGTRFGQSVYAIQPISCYLQLLGTGTDLRFRNVSYADKTVTFSSPEGCSITKVGGGTADDCTLLVKDKSKNLYDGRFVTKGWGGENWQDNGLVFKIKATSRLVGNLRFGFGVFAAATSKVPKNWKIVWSNDNTNWNDGVKILTVPFTTQTDTFGLVADINNGGYKMAYFNVEESKAVAEGGYLYVKIMQADNACHVAGQEVDPATGELIFQHGFYLTTHEKRAYHTSTLPSGANVLLTEGFDDAFLGHDNFIPCWQFMTNYKAPYTLPEGWASTGGIYEMPGYIRAGASGSAASSITTPALTALGDVPTNITLKFKASILLVAAAGYVPDNTSTVVSASTGTVVSQPDFTMLPSKITDVNETNAVEMEKAYHKWYEFTIPITGATKDTKITITNTGRHFIDDIVITRD